MECGEIKWIAATGRYIAVMGGPQFNRYPERMRRVNESVAPFRSAGQVLRILDGPELKTVWEEKREGDAEAFDPCTAAIANGRLFVCTVGGKAQAYRMVDGKPQWSTDTGFKRRTKIGDYEWDVQSRHPVSAYAPAKFYVISGVAFDEDVVLSQADGQEFWRADKRRDQNAPLFFKDILWFGGEGRDPATGQQKRSASVNLHGCGHFTAAPQGIVGQGGLTWDAVEDRHIPIVPGRGMCGTGSFVANGLIWKNTNACGHDPEWRGFIIRGPAEEEVPPAEPRLTRSSDLPGPAEEIAGWTTYRANTARSASSSARVADKAGVAWTFSPAQTGPVAPGGGVLLGAEIVPLPPVICGEIAVVGCTDGTIQALDLKNGKLRWRARTGGAIQSSPTIWKGRVYAGSSDGCVYAFALEDGRELWRLRVAPEAGRMMLYDQLGSRWPVLGAPMVANGRVFALAGFMNRLDGLCAVAADAVSGEVLWERTDWKDAEVEDLYLGTDVMGGTGQFCWDGEKGELVYSAGEGLPVRLAADDGAVRAAYARGRVKEISTDHKTRLQFPSLLFRSGGQDPGKLAPGWMVFGGGRLLADQIERSGHHRKEPAFVAQTDDGDGRFPVLHLKGSYLMPSWDEEDVLLTLKGRPDVLALVPKARFTEHLTACMPGEGEKLEWMMRDIAVNQDGLLRWQTEFGPRHTWPITTVLTGNAALVLTKQHATESPRLKAFRRTDGKELWQMDLPATPIVDGLAVGADGRILVALCDGKVICIGRP
jgi:outer membrane protein assembly factor BamB